MSTDKRQSRGTEWCLLDTEENLWLGDKYSLFIHSNYDSASVQAQLITEKLNYPKDRIQPTYVHLSAFVSVALSRPGMADLFYYQASANVSAKEVEAEKQVEFKNGCISSPMPRFELIPRDSMVALARRFERGVRIKKNQAWNALVDPKSADDEEFVINRLAHCVDHCLKAIARIKGTMEPLDAEGVADGGDAGAIMFAGALLACYQARKK